MNGLVGYNSSDEEDNEEPSPTLASPKPVPVLIDQDTSVRTNGTDQKGSLTAHAETRQESAPIQGPMVGPAMPTESALPGYEDDDVEDLPQMPERDMLRYLTQPSRPMTSLPPETDEYADPGVTSKIKRLLEFKAKGRHFNEDLATNTSFRNPNLFASLLERGNLPPQVQYASSLPSNLFSPDSFPDWAYKENLHKSQKEISSEIEATKKADSAVGKRTIDFTPATGNGVVNHKPVSANSLKRRRD